MSQNKRSRTGEAPELRVDARRLVRAVLVVGPAIAVFLLLIDWYAVVGLGARTKSMRQLFDSAREDGLASFYCVALTILTATALWGIAFASRARSPQDGRRALGWSVLALAFSYIAVDDGAQLHERASSWLQARSIVGGDEGAGLGLPFAWFPSYGWQVLFLPAFALLGLFMAVFLHRELKARLPRRLVIAALACWALAIGLDFCEGLDESHPLSLRARLMSVESLERQAVDVLRTTPRDLADHLTKSVEETIEVLGVCLFLAAFLSELLSTADGLVIRVSHLPGEKTGPSSG